MSWKYIKRLFVNSQMESTLGAEISHIATFFVDVDGVG